MHHKSVKGLCCLPHWLRYLTKRQHHWSSSGSSRKVVKAAVLVLLANISCYVALLFLTSTYHPWELTLLVLVSMAFVSTPLSGTFAAQKHSCKFELCSLVVISYQEYLQSPKPSCPVAVCSTGVSKLSFLCIIWSEILCLVRVLVDYANLWWHGKFIMIFHLYIVVVVMAKILTNLCHVHHT